VKKEDTQRKRRGLAQPTGFVKPVAKESKPVEKVLKKATPVPAPVQ
jgi:hypothetical protein